MIKKIIEEVSESELDPETVTAGFRMFYVCFGRHNHAFVLATDRTLWDGEVITMDIS